MTVSLQGAYSCPFALMQKDQKIKAAAIAPRAQPGQRTRDRTTGREDFLMLARQLGTFFRISLAYVGRYFSVWYKERLKALYSAWQK